jgi:hypothetical protein
MRRLQLVLSIEGRIAATVGAAASEASARTVGRRAGGVQLSTAASILFHSPRNMVVRRLVLLAVGLE